MSELTKEWLLKTIAELEEERDATPGAVNEDAAMALAAMKLALASLESDPVMYVMVGEDFDSDATSVSKAVVDSWVEEWNQVGDLSFRTVPLYAAPPAPVVPAELHPDTKKLVTDFCTALAEKLYKAQLKYGYDADWKQDGWPNQCQTHFHQHIAKGDPRDVAAYCAFMWYHGWKTEPAPVSVPDIKWPEEKFCPAEYAGSQLWEETEIWNKAIDACKAACRAAMLQGADGNIGKPLTIKLPDISSKAFWSGNGKNETFHPETYRRWVKEAIETSCTIARVDVEVK